MNRRNVILTGFMGTGKTLVGRMLAEQLGWHFIDTDELIELRAGMSIADIFREHGESTFRAWEATVAKELAGTEETVIATGGRLMLDQKNAEHLSRSAVVFCLTASAEEIARRLARETEERPLLAGQDPAARIAELLASREAGYSRFRQIETEGRNVTDVANEIRALMIRQITTVSSPDGEYNVTIGPDTLSDLRRIAEVEGLLAVISDSNVGPLYAARCGADIQLTMPAGEPYKTLATAGELYEQLVEKGFDRQGTIVALGGGVVGDVAGFVAATYMRGVDLVQCPTSLLAMVDASVGGKTAVDLPQGKNLVGAFKQPRAVIADLVTLASLPDVEFSAGLAEVIKSGMIADPALFALVEEQAEALMDRAALNQLLLSAIVGKSVEVKRNIVENDPYEKGQRAWLNLGHTFGHAIERVSRYEIRHGEAVAMGLVAACHLSAELGACSPSLERRVAEALAGVELPTQIPPRLGAESIYDAMWSDKKKLTGSLRFVLPHEIGDVFITNEPQAEQVIATLRHCGAGPM